MSAKRLVKVRRDKRIAGVCSGLARYSDIDVTVVRIGFVLATVLGFGSPILIYIILVLMMPSE